MISCQVAYFETVSMDIHLEDLYITEPGQCMYSYEFLNADTDPNDLDRVEYCMGLRRGELSEDNTNRPISTTVKLCTDMIEAFKQGKWALFPDEETLKILQVTLKENAQQPAATRHSWRQILPPESNYAYRLFFYGINVSTSTVGNGGQPCKSEETIIRSSLHPCLAIPSACRFIYHTRHGMFIPLSIALPVLNCRMMPTITTSFLRQSPGLLRSIPLHAWEDTGEFGAAEDPVLCRLVVEN
ncbi:hypothetical protein AB1N83_013714 [Pleurotus pulmonarius]